MSKPYVFKLLKQDITPNSPRLDLHLSPPTTRSYVTNMPVTDTLYVRR